MTEEELNEWQGFVYQITTPEGKKYIGCKNLWKIAKLKPLKGKKRRRLVKKKTDWETYYSSSETIKDDVKLNGGDKYHREILVFCEAKGIMAYREAHLQFKHNVLFSDEFLNRMINCRINATTVEKYKP